MNSKIFIPFLCILSIVSYVHAGGLLTQQVIILESDERLVGQILPQSDDETIYFRSKILGELSLSRSAVKHISSVDQSQNCGTSETLLSDKNSPPVERELSLEQADAKTPSQYDVGLDLDEEDTAGYVTFLNNLWAYRTPETWNGNFRFGLNFSQGDSIWEETAINGLLEVQGPDNPHFYRYSGNYNYRRNERPSGEKFKSTDRYALSFIYRRIFAEHWFLQSSLAGRSDQIKGIDQEIQGLFGLGYKYRRDETLEIILGAGGGVESLDAVTSFQEENLTPVANVFQELTWSPIERTSFVQKFDYFWNPDDAEFYNYVITAAIRLRLTDLFGLEFSYSQNFDNVTDSGDTGDDVRWRNAFILYF